MIKKGNGILWAELDTHRGWILTSLIEGMEIYSIQGKGTLFCLLIFHLFEMLVFLLAIQSFFADLPFWRYSSLLLELGFCLDHDWYRGIPTQFNPNSVPKDLIFFRTNPIIGIRSRAENYWRLPRKGKDFRVS